MKISRKIKIYSSLFSFAVLSGIAITASSCASNETTENNSSSQNPENQQPSKENPAGGASNSKAPIEPKEPNKKDNPEKQGKQPQSLPDASQLFAKSYEVKQNQKFQVASKAAQQINIDNLNEYVNLPEVNIANLTFSIKSVQANDESGTIDVALNQILSGKMLDKTISFQITGFPTKVINYVPLQPAIRNISYLFDKTYNVSEDKSNQLASTAVQELNIGNLGEYITLPTIPNDFKIEIDSLKANDVLGTIDVVLKQFYLENQIPNKIVLQITGFKLRDLSSLFASSYQVTTQNSNQLASTAAKDLTLDKLKELVNFPEITSEFQLSIKSTTTDDFNGTINVVLEQTYQEVIMPNEISFQITGFTLRSSASLFANTYDVMATKSASLPSSIISQLTSYDALTKYVNFPEIPNDFSFELNSVKANDVDNSIDVVLDQTYLSNPVNDPISFKIINFNNGISSSWIPVNDDLIRSGIADLTNKKEFDQFIVNHWNQSLANDALNAIRWVYNNADDQKTLTSDLRQYIKEGWNAGGWIHWTIGYLMGYDDSGEAKGFNPTYTSDVSLQPNGDLRLTLGWYQKQYYQRTVGGNYTADVNGSIYFDVKTSTKPSIDSTTGNAQILNTRIEGMINNEAPGRRPTVHDGATVTINILDALYYYYNQESSEGIAIKNQMFSTNSANASDWSKNPYSLFGPLFKIKDTDKNKFIYRK